MNNDNKVKETYQSAIEQLPISEDFERNTLQLIEEAKQKETKQKDTKRGKTRKPIIKQKRFYVSMAACVVLIVLIPLSLILTRPGIDLERSSEGVRVTYVKKVPKVNRNYDLIELTEEQIINEWSDAAFRGTVEEIRNIKISFGIGSRLNEYRAIATIKVGEIYHGDMKPGDLVEILLPCPITNDIWVEDTEMVSALRVGTEGIFLPLKYDDESKMIQWGSTIYWKEIADYGFADGVRFAFLRTEQGVLYSDWAFDINPTPASLEDVAKYITTMIDK